MKNRTCGNCRFVDRCSSDKPCINCSKQSLWEPKVEELPVHVAPKPEPVEELPVHVAPKPEPVEEDPMAEITINLGVLRRARQVMKDYLNDEPGYISDVVEQQIIDDIYQLDQAIGDTITTEQMVDMLETILDAIEAKPSALNLKTISLYEFECIKDFVSTLPRRVK